MSKVKFGKNLQADYKRAQSRMNYYNKKYEIQNDTNKRILHETRHNYTQAIKKYNEGHMSKSELLRYRKELQTTVKTIEHEYSKQNKSVLENLNGDEIEILKQPTQRDITEYTRRLGMHGVNEENSINKLDYVANVLGIDTDEMLHELYKEGKEGNIKYKTIVDENGKKYRVAENEFLGNLREKALRLANTGQISQTELEKVYDILS